ncbi:MAG: YwaF family protein [Oscillospiraceae bacterium]|nr:YwaF family protein [Oscillospiraceae bacterium]
MREFLFKLFSMSYFDTGIQITPFSGAHIVYLILIFGSIVGGWFALRGKSVKAKEKALRLLAYALVISYLSDFFVHDFVYGGMNIDKLPFHICTVLCPLVAIAQFNKNGHKIAEPAAVLATLAPMMYLCYPASVGSGEPWCYQAVQTMFYHGVLMAWGILSIALGAVELRIEKVWKSAALLVGITLWAKLGNLALEHNWFFLEEDAFYIGLVANGIIPKWVLMIVNPVVFFLAVLAVYGVVYGVRALSRKKTVA